MFTSIFFKTNLITKLPETKGHLVLQNFNASHYHPVEQIMKISDLNECNILFLTYNSLKTQCAQRKLIGKGLNQLLEKAQLPVVLIKENMQIFFKLLFFTLFYQFNQ